MITKPENTRLQRFCVTGRWRCAGNEMAVFCRRLDIAENEDGVLAEELCLACGLCCNGVIFADLQLRGVEEIARLKALGFQTSAKGCRAGATPRQKTALVSQPCAAFDGCRCGIYAQRPQYCRKFECLLLKGVQAEKTEVSQALGVIRTARQRAERVRKLLHDLADTNEHLPLALRFRRMTRRVERLGLEDRLAETYGELTLAFHDLNRLLSDCFYPHRG